MTQFKANGVEYNLQFKTLAMLRYEQKSKASGSPESVLAAAEKMQAGDLTMERLIRLFWCGLSPMPQTEEEVAAIVDELGLVAAMEALGNALSEGLGGLAEDSSADPTKASTKKR